LTVAVSDVVAPTAIDAEAGDTVTVVTTGAGGGEAVTVMEDVPDFPAQVAVIVAEPAATPVTTPAALTVAAAALFVDHVTVCPLITFPCSSLTVATSVVVAPAPTVAVDGVTVTLVTTGAGGGGGAVTVTSDVPLFPALVAVMVAAPAAMPVTVPSDATVAVAPLLVDHAIV